MTNLFENRKKEKNEHLKDKCFIYIRILNNLECRKLQREKYKINHQVFL